MKIVSITLLLTCLACGTAEDVSTSDRHADADTSPTTSSDEVETPDESVNTGSHPTSCGAESQGLEPVDCTQHGDVNAQCVYSNHCYCTFEDGYVCEEKEAWMDVEECAPGSTCVAMEDG